MTNKILQEKIYDVISIYRELSSVKDLVPSRIINTNFSKLVSIVDVTPDDLSREILRDSKIAMIQQNLRKLSSQGEFELEYFWVKRILASNHAHTTFIQFPYYENYERMTSFEMDAMKSCDIHEIHKVLFVGSGPLPMSSIMIAGKHGVYVDNLDIDKEACDLSSELIKALDLSEKVKIMHKNIFDITDFSAYNCIFVAALAGEDEGKKYNIIEHIASYAEKGTHIVLRSVSNLGALLYPEIKTDHMKNIDVLKRYDRPRGVINNIIIGRTK